MTILLADKITAVGALIGVFLMLAISRPAITEALLRGGVGFLSSVVATKPLIDWHGWPTDNDTRVFVAAALAFAAWYILQAAQDKLELLKKVKIGRIIEFFRKGGL